jgi:hypothetical protein
MAIPTAQTPKEIDDIRRLQTRSAVYYLLVAYFVVVALNAVSVVLLVWARALGWSDIDYTAIGALAVGTGGLGAGSFAFQAPIRAIFETGFDQPRIPN